MNTLYMTMQCVERLQDLHSGPTSLLKTHIGFQVDNLMRERERKRERERDREREREREREKEKKLYNEKVKDIYLLQRTNFVINILIESATSL